LKTIYSKRKVYLYIFGSNIPALLKGLQSLSVSVSLKKKGKKTRKKQERKN